MTKKIYCVLDTETVGGACKVDGIYHLGGVILDRQGNVYGSFNYVIMEHYAKIDEAFYGKKNFAKYQDMILNGEATCVPTEDMAINMVDMLCDYLEVTTMCAFNSGFDFTKTACASLLEGREFIDLWLMALQTLTNLKGYAKFCGEYGFVTPKGNCLTSAEKVYAFITNDSTYEEEHTAFADSSIEADILLACLKRHKKFTKNVHCFDYKGKKYFPKPI